MSQSKPLVVTAGEPAGIGPEICLALAGTPHARDVVIIADPHVLHDRARRCGIEVEITEIDVAVAGEHRAEPGELCVIAEPFPAPPRPGEPDPRNAGALLAGLERAVAGCREGVFAGLVTAPLQKSVINDAGIPFSGHTEYLAELTATEKPVMLLVAGDLRVALATTHLPLSAVPESLTSELLQDVLMVLIDGLETQFRIRQPSIIVCGLNPHAGEGGHLGGEDAAVIAPVVEDFVGRGFRVRGPLPADTAFTPAAGPRDAVLAMFHDQGLPVIKYAGFGHAVNVTLGLPIVRTSVDHGTALDIAGRGESDPGSLIAAIVLAKQLASA